MAIVDQQLAMCDEFMAKICDRLEQAQQQYKGTYNKHHNTLEFAVGIGFGYAYCIDRWPPSTSMAATGLVQGSTGRSGSWNASARWRINWSCRRVPNVFYVKGPTPDLSGVLPPTIHGRACPQPAEVIKGRLARGV